MTAPNSTLPFPDLERVYERLAAAIDTAGSERESVMLTKLALSLAHRLGDLSVVETCIDMALQDLEPNGGNES